MHPLAPQENVAVGIQRERELMSPFRDGADLLIDTTDLTVRKLRAKMGAYFEERAVSEGGLQITIVSFGYKYGLPLDADVVFDVRFLPNPHWVEHLRPRAASIRKSSTTSWGSRRHLTSSTARRTSST